MKTYSLLGNFIDAEPNLCYLIPSYTDHILLGFFSVSIFIRSNSHMLFLYILHQFNINCREIPVLFGIETRMLTALACSLTPWRIRRCFQMVQCWIALDLSTSAFQNTLLLSNSTSKATTVRNLPKYFFRSLFLNEFSMICQ